MKVIFDGLIKILDTAIDLLQTGKAPIDIAENITDDDIEKLKSIILEIENSGIEICLVGKNNSYDLYLLLEHSDLYQGTGILGLNVNPKMLSKLFEVNKKINYRIGGRKLWKELIEDTLVI